MSIIKNEIPLLEYDTDSEAVINPTHEDLKYEFPSKCVFVFIGDYIDTFAKENNAKVAGTFINVTKEYPVYVMDYKGTEICLCQAPVGAAAAAQLMDWLIGYGVKEIVSAGSCGVLTDLPEGIFLVPYKALREEGTSYQYLPPSRFVEINSSVRKAMEQTIQEHGMDYKEVITWSTDGFYRETKEKVAYRRDEGCTTVEMECSALAACAKFRGVQWGMILYTADSLANVEDYDERTWGGQAEKYALRLCMDAVLRINVC